MLEKGVNSYVTLAEATAYFSDRLDAAAWADADDALREQALVTAAKQLNLTRWVGTIADKSQTLAFPRKGTYFEPLYNDYVKLDGVSIPQRITVANMEYAYHLMNNDGALDYSGTPDRIKVDVIELEGLQSTYASTPAMSTTVTNLIKPLEYSSNTMKPSGSWWRAN
jgi:hypothetical protein